MGIFDSKKLLIVAGMILALFIGIAIGYGFKSNSTASPSNFADNILKEIIPGNKNSNIVDLVKVVRVVDGDTIEIEGGEKVRYIGIDTPETVDPRKSVQCFGVEASKKNKEMVEGKMVRLEKDITDRDKYNRLLRYIWIDDVLVNLELVNQGFAYSYSYPPDIKYQDQIVKAQQEAKDASRGLWSACPAQTVIPTLQENNPDGSCLIKGNISTSGEKIYHLLGCGSYSKTQIDEKRGERWFCSESEAQAAGWRKALNCQ
ncbi:MAG: thermonuclease family protein [Candidatus Azambacteria bacterium]|nr:thermonuclease family protein [Candidatus Azambacteria bacterium]